MKPIPILPTSWAALIQQYLTALRAAGHPQTTIETRRQHLHYLARYILCTPENVTIDTLITWASEQDWAPETRRTRYNSYRLFWNWATRNGHLSTNAAADLPKVKAYVGIPRPTPDQAYMRAIMTSSPRTRLILRLAAEAGLRRAEIAVIHTRDLVHDLVGTSLIVHGKGRKQRIVPLTNSLAETLSEHEGYLFPGKINGHLSPRRIGELATEVLPGHWTLHTLRHRFATRAYSITHDTYAVQDLLGHSSAETTRRYVAAEPSRLRDLVARAAG